MENTKIQTETVEVCPFCDQENIYLNWDVEERGYVAKCHHCGKLIMLCDECMHDEGSCIKCNWTKEHNCFRAQICIAINRNNVHNNQRRQKL